MEKPSVVYICRGTNADYMVEFLNAMSKHVSGCVALSSKDEFIAARLVPEIRVYQSGMPRVLSLGNIGAMVRLIRYIKKVDPDVVHFQNGVIWELALKFFIRKPVFVVTVHELVKHPSHHVIDTISTPQFFLMKALRLANAVIVHAPHVQRVIQGRFPDLVRGKPVSCVPLGVISRYGTGEAPVVPKGPNVLLFGTVAPYKGVETLIEAEPLIRRAIPDVNIVVAGKCTKPEYYRGLVRDGQRIDLRLRRQTDDETRELFKWADVLVLPYIEATQSAVLQLGFSFGVPAVVTNAGGLADVITNEENGLVVEPKDPAALAEAVVRLISDQVLRERVIKNVVICRQTVYNWSNIAEQVAVTYKELLRAKQPEGGAPCA